MILSDEGLRGETISQMCYGSARGLAKLAVYMANQGKIREKQLISKQTWLEMHSDFKIDLDRNHNGKQIYTNRFK